MERRFDFKGTMDLETLLSYTSRAVTHQILCIDSPILDEDIRLIKNVGAKFIGRAAHFSWAGHLTANQVEAHFKKAAESADKIHLADSQIILQAGVFEIIYRDTVNNMKIPSWVFEAFNLPAEDRNFKWEDMIFPEDFDFGGTDWGAWGDKNFWNEGAAWPFIGNVETQMYFYYVICRYIDIGFEAVHLGQADKMTGLNLTYYSGWDRVTTVARQYAQKHARRGIILFDCHTIFGFGNMKIEDRLIIDIVGSALVPTDTVKEDGVLKCVLSDVSEHDTTWLGRSEGGQHPLGFQVDICPTIMEFDNYGRIEPVGEFNEIYSPWGYDDITWFALQPKWYRDEFLLESAKKLKNIRLDKNGRQVYFIQPQLRRCLCLNGDDPTVEYTPGKDFDNDYFENYIKREGITSKKNQDGSYTLTTSKEYRANNQSDSCPNGFGQEDTIKRIFQSKFKL